MLVLVERSVGLCTIVEQCGLMEMDEEEEIVGIDVCTKVVFLLELLLVLLLVLILVLILLAELGNGKERLRSYGFRCLKVMEAHLDGLILIFHIIHQS